MAPPCRLILNFCWCHLILSFSLLALEGERGERRLKTWRQAVSVHHPPAACPLVFHLLLLGVAIIVPVMRAGREKRSAVKRMRPLTSYLRSSSGLSSPDLKTQPICPVHPSSFPRPRRREGKGRCTRNPSVYSLFLLLPEQKGRREETKRRDGWSVS